MSGLAFTDDFATNNSSSNQLGVAWQVQAGTFIASAGTLRSVGGFNVATLNGVTQADVTVSADVSLGSGATPYFGLIARQSGVGFANFYWGVLAKSNSTVFAQIQRFVNGAGMTLVSVPVSGNLGTGTLSFATIGTALRLLLNGKVIAQTNDSALTSGDVGIASSIGTSITSFSSNAVAPTAPVTLSFSDSLAISAGGPLTAR